MLTSLTDVSNLEGGWYVVQGKVEYSNQVKFSGDAHLILADEAKLEIVTEGESEHGIYASNNLTIYGQSEQSGILNDTAKGSAGSGIYSYFGDITIIGGKVTATGGAYGIYSSNGVKINGGIVTAVGYDGIYCEGDMTISGGKVTATSTRGYGIYGNNGVTINGGSVTAYGYYDGIYSDNGRVTISGGKVTATSTMGSGIYGDNGNITLGWTNSTDFIKVSSIHLGADSCTVSIAEGKSFKAEDGKAYSGTLTGEQLSAIKGKTLEPCYAVTFDAQNGDEPIMLLTAFDENGVAHVEKPNDPIRSGFTFEGWFTTKDGNTEFDFTATVTENTTAYAHWNENTPVKYIDENGGTNETKNYILLTNDINVDNLPGGWYVVQSEVKYTSQVTFYGEAHLILADDAKMEIKSEDFGIYANENLTIYGQGGQSGTLNVTALDEIMGSSSSTGVFSDGNITISGGSVTATSTNGVGIYSDNGVTISGGSVTATGKKGDGIYCYNGGVTISGGSVTAYGYYDGIYSDNGGVTISGGSVTATGENDNGIYSYNGVSISGGSVTAYGYYDGIYSYNGGVTISGGSVTATGENGDGIYTRAGHITLGWTNSTDSIKVSSIHLGVDSCTVSIAEGKSFKDDKGKAYRGTLTGEQLSAIEGKKLEPCYAVTFDAQNGDEPIMLLTTFDENGVAHVEKPNDPIRDGFTFEGWFTATDGNTEFDFTATVTGNTTAYAHWNENTPVQYIDENGNEKSIYEYTVLTAEIAANELPGGWYVLENSDPNYTDLYLTNTLWFSGDVNLILADGADMGVAVEKGDAINVAGKLTVYGQSNQTGTLYASGSENGINAENGIVVNGGCVKAYGGEYKYGFNGGENGVDIHLKHYNSYILGSSYREPVTVSGLALHGYENNGIYEGGLDKAQIENMAYQYQLLEPCYVVKFDKDNNTDPEFLAATFNKEGVALVAITAGLP